MKIYFAGQDNFGNRGCEALIRANVKTISAVMPGTQFYVPSGNIANDQKQWPEHAQFNVEFIRSEPMPERIRWWSRLRRILPLVSNIRPKFQLTAYTQDKIAECDAVLMTGGDIISLDYGLESLFYWQQICEAAMAMNKKTVLWAGSVGPFTKLPAIEKIMRDFLRRFDLITVRETASFHYLESLGIDHVKLVTDPAFVLDVDQVPLPALFEAGNDVLGFNVSPLITKFRGSEEKKNELEQEVIDFLDEVIRVNQTHVLLVPHVDPLDGRSENSDSAYMEKILAKLRARGHGPECLDILPRGYNAIQLKGVIAHCSYFMGARTHATVAAISQKVPTTSIAYSIKAKGINQDLFGHLDYVLETPEVNKSTLSEHFSILKNNRDSIIEFLTDKLKTWKEKSSGSAKFLSLLFDKV